MEHLLVYQSCRALTFALARFSCMKQGVVDRPTMSAVHAAIIINIISRMLLDPQLGVEFAVKMNNRPT